MAESGPTFVFFLGGRDLEMVTIAKLLASCDASVHDRQLGWGAKASAYAEEIATCRAAGQTAVLIELIDDLELSQAVAAGVVFVDHHGDRAGEDQPTSLEQVFQLLGSPPGRWSRQYDLVAANDRAYIEGMLALDPPATRAELEQIRAADRAAQGITPEEEAQGRAAVDHCVWAADGRLTIVQLEHSRTATVTDVLHTSLGGPGYQNILILSPQQTLFQGSGRAIEWLKAKYPHGWWGGALPQRGFWGIAQRLAEAELIPQLEEYV